MKKGLVRHCCLIITLILLLGMIPGQVFASELKSITLYLDGYDLGKDFKDLTITTANEDLIIKTHRYADADRHVRDEGTIRAWKDYLLFVDVSHATDNAMLEKMLYIDSVMLDDIPAHLTQLTDDGATFVFRLPALIPSDCEEISFDLEGYSSGKDVEDVKAVTKNKNIVIEKFEVYADITKPDVLETELSSSVYYCFAITFRAASAEVEQKVRDAVAFRMVDLETVTPFAVIEEDGAYTVRFRLGCPGSPKSGARKPYAAFDMTLSGFEVGKSMENVTVNIPNEAYSAKILDISLNRMNNDLSTALVAGVHSHVTMEITTNEDMRKLILTEGIKLYDNRPCYLTFTDTGCIATFLMLPQEADLALDMKGYNPAGNLSGLGCSAENDHLKVRDISLLQPKTDEPYNEHTILEDTPFMAKVRVEYESDYFDTFFGHILFAAQEAKLDDYVPMNCLIDEYGITLIYQLDPLHGHKLVFVPEQLPTCFKEGKNAYYQCECGNFFEDEDAKVGILFLSTWGNIPMIDHTESDWKWDENQHWKECTADGCGEILDGTQEDHLDADGDHICDTCAYNIAAEPEPTEPDMEEEEGGSTGDMPVWISITLTVVILAIYITAVIVSKRFRKADAE